MRHLRVSALLHKIQIINVDFHSVYVLSMRLSSIMQTGWLNSNC